MYFSDYIKYDAEQNEPNIYSNHFDNNGKSKEQT